jgi:hypothetical protein
MRTIPWRYRIPHAWRHRPAPCPGTLWQVLLVAIVYSLGACGALRHICTVGRVPDRGPTQALAAGLVAFQRGDFEGAASR